MEILCIITYRKTSVLWFFFSKIGGCRPKAQLKKELHHRKFLFLVNIFSRRRWDHKFSTNYHNNDRNQFFFITHVKTLNFLTFDLEAYKKIVLYIHCIYTYFFMLYSFLPKRYAHGMFAAGRAFVPTQEKKMVSIRNQMLCFLNKLA